MKSVCLLNSVMNPFLYAFTLHKKLNKSGAEHNDITTMSSTSSKPPWRWSPPCLLLVGCFMVGLPVNVAVFIDICRRYKRYASKVNPNLLLLVLNLALVDSVTLSTSPFFAYELMWGFTFGDAFCKMFYYILTSCLFVSVMTVTGISMTFFHAIKFGVANPRQMARLRSRRKVLFLGGVWAVALLLSISTLYTRRLAVLFLETVVGFVLPFLTLLMSYVFVYRDSMKIVCLLNSVINPFLYAFTLRKKLNKSGTEHNDTTTMTVTAGNA
ncbi:unnamed protein product [Merluccius merluccius]